MTKTVSPTGEIHDEKGSKLFKEISELIEHNDVILDLSRVTFISSKPFGQFVALSRLAEEAGKAFQVHGANARIRRAIDFLHLAELVDVD